MCLRLELLVKICFSGSFILVMLQHMIVYVALIFLQPLHTRDVAPHNKQILICLFMF